MPRAHVPGGRGTEVLHRAAVTAPFASRKGACPAGCRLGGECHDAGCEPGAASSGVEMGRAGIEEFM